MALAMIVAMPSVPTMRIDSNRCRLRTGSPANGHPPMPPQPSVVVMMVVVWCLPDRDSLLCTKVNDTYTTRSSYTTNALDPACLVKDGHRGREKYGKPR